MELLLVAQRYEMCYTLVHIRGSIALQPFFVKEMLCKAVGAVLQVTIIEVPLFSKVHALNGAFSLSDIFFNVCGKLEGERIVWGIPDILGKPKPNHSSLDLRLRCQGVGG